MESRVTIIITVYKRTDYLHVAIQSAIRQTYPHLEIIVADDSGEGIARGICAQFEHGRQIIYRQNPRNLGIAESLRSALKIAKGEYVAVLNDDDYWDPTFVEKMVGPLQQDPDRVLSFSDHWVVNEEGKVDVAFSDANTKLYGRAKLSSGDVPDTAKFVLKHNGIPLAMASVFRKSALDSEILTAKVGGSYDFWISCALAATNGKFYYVAERLTYYRSHRQSETARKAPDKNLSTIFIYEQLLYRGWFPGMRSWLSRRIAGAYFRCGRDLLWFGQKKDAREMFTKSFQKSLNWKSAIALILSFLPATARRHLRLERKSG